MFIQTFFYFILNLDKTLPPLVDQYHNIIFILLFFIIFSETGFVVTPFLPGDSLIFAAATLAASGKLNPFVLFPVILCASILGDNTNYQIGHFLSQKVRSKQKIRFVKTEYIDRTHHFFLKSTAERPSSLRSSCRSSGRFPHLWQGWEA